MQSAHFVGERLAIAHWNAASLLGGLHSMSHRQTKDSNEVVRIVKGKGAQEDAHDARV